MVLNPHILGKQTALYEYKCPPCYQNAHSTWYRISYHIIRLPVHRCAFTFLHKKHNNVNTVWLHLLEMFLIE